MSMSCKGAMCLVVITEGTASPDSTLNEATFSSLALAQRFPKRRKTNKSVKTSVTGVNLFIKYPTIIFEENCEQYNDRSISQGLIGENWGKLGKSPVKIGLCEPGEGAIRESSPIGNEQAIVT